MASAAPSDQMLRSSDRLVTRLRMAGTCDDPGGGE